MNRRRLLLAVPVPVLAVAAWWLLSSTSTNAYFPPLSTSLRTFRDAWLGPQWTVDLLPSILRFAGGFAIAIIVGVGVGFMIGTSRTVRTALGPLLEYGRATPIAALVPIGLAVLGPGTVMETSLIAFAAVWPIMLNTVDGVRSVDEVALDTAEVYNLGPRARWTSIVIPSAMPQIFAGLRIGLSIALAAMVISNMFGSSEGLGYYIINAQYTFDMPAMWAGLIAIGILGALTNIIFLMIEGRALAWHRGWRQLNDAR